MRRNKIISVFFIVIAAVVSACSDDDTGLGDASSVTVYKVAVVMPHEKQEKLNRIAALFNDNIRAAQEGMKRQTKIELECIDENSEGWMDKVQHVVADTSYRAVIGPYTSDNAAKVALECAQYKKTLVLPTVTSAELQRIYAGKGYVWCLTEPDIAQCEIMLTHAQLYGAKGVYLLVCDNSYGQTFLDWAGYQATELGMEIYKTWTYSSEEELTHIVSELEELTLEHNQEDVFQSLLFVPSCAEDLVALDKAQNNAGVLPFIIHNICSDMAYSPTTAPLFANSMCSYEGYALSASPSSGFNQFYQIEYDEQPESGDAQFYDALLLLYYGLISMEVHHDTDLNNALKRVVVGREGTAVSWMPDDIRMATADLRAGGNPDIEGASGTFEFDANKYTTVLHSVYSHWILQNGEFKNIGYESTDGGLRTSASSAVWDWAKTFQSFDENINITYPSPDKQWALIVATSTSWKNYRHQADAFAMYQVLKRHGYDDDHIVLIVSDDYAYNPNNPTPGEIRVRTNGTNVYDKDIIDYDIKDVSPQDLQAILSGQKSDKLPHVLSPDADDNIFIFWSGHGIPGSLLWKENGQGVSANDIRSMFEHLSDNHCYRQALFAIEACYSGSIGEQCKGIPGLLLITAANANESSWAEQKDLQMHIYLSNAFTRTFEETIDEQPDIMLRNLYYNLARTTSGSHVMVYNEKEFGNLYNTPMTTFLNK